MLFSLPSDPQKLAWREPGRSVTYSELQDSVLAGAERLESAGLGRGSIIALGGLPPFEVLRWLLAAEAAGFAAAPLNPRLTDGERDRYLAMLDAAAVLGADDVLRTRSTEVRTDAVLLLSTSATTGDPKIARLTRENLIANLPQMLDGLAVKGRPVSADDTFLLAMPLFHLTGIASVLLQWSAGGTVVYPGSFEAARFAAYLEEYRPTWISASPPTLIALTDLAGELPRSLRFVRFTGAALPEDRRLAAEARLGVPVLETYGMTEGGMLGTAPVVDGVRATGWFRPLAGVIWKLSPAGEILVKAPTITPGYHRDPAATAAAFDADGWFRTGDLGEENAAGQLRIAGRLKELINRGGEKVLPLEIDEAMSRHPNVAEAAAFGVPHPTLGEDVACAYVSRSGEDIAAAELRRHCRALLSPEKLPRHFFSVERIPRGATGKPQRHLLRLPPMSIADAGSVPAPLVRIWQEVLEHQPAFQQSVFLNEDFFRSGGDSLKAAILLTEVAAEFGVALHALEPFLDSPALSHLWELVQQAPSTDRHPEWLSIRAEASGIPVFAIPPTRDHLLTFRELAWELDGSQPVHILASSGVEPDRRPGHVEEAARRSVAWMQELQPSGSCVLIGHCYGGVVAFEAARQWLASGRELEALFLIETPCPGDRHLNSRWSALERIVPLPRATSIAYQPVEIAAAVEHFIAADAVVSDHLLEDPRRSWKRFAGTFQVHPVDGNHETILQSRAARRIAERVRTRLSAALGPSAAGTGPESGRRG